MKKVFEIRKTLSAMILASIAGLQSASAEPPFRGTIFIDRDIITAEDPTTFLSVSPKGRGVRTMFDRRKNAFVKINARLFSAHFSDSLVVEIQVNPEFSISKSAKLAKKYADVIGRLPKCLRVDVDTVWIHAGVEPLGGGNRNLLIHTGQAALYEKDGILEETLVHEASHTSLDSRHAGAKGWLAAQKSDPEFISTYARDNPTREDVAETFLLWLAVRHRAERMDPAVVDVIRKTVPGRLKYFDKAKLDVRPVD